MSRYVDIEPYEKYVLQRYYRNSMGECVETVPLCGLPTADVAEVRHGKWVIEKKMFPYIYPKWSCSECGEETTETTGWGTKPRYNYCPNCGAIMDKEEPNAD